MKNRNEITAIPDLIKDAEVYLVAVSVTIGAMGIN